MKPTKYCPSCAQEKEIGAFGVNAARPDKLQSQCRECKKLTQDRWYKKNKARHIANVTKRRRQVETEIIDSMIAYLREHPCVDCGEDNPVVLEFDHVKGHKRNSICNMIRAGCSWEHIYEEMQKCEVRCCKCHRIKTAKQFGYRKMIRAALT